MLPAAHIRMSSIEADKTSEECWGAKLGLGFASAREGYSLTQATASLLYPGSLLTFQV
jgi:hypothetical protein